MDYVGDIIKQHLQNPLVYFIFPTDVSASTWSDYAVQFPPHAIATERFMAWDSFKAEAIRAVNQDKISIPSTIRSLFAEKICVQNKKKVFFKYIINPQYANYSSTFADWIQSVLPSLASLKKYLLHASYDIDTEITDFLLLEKAYSNFLNTHNFFEPAWEKPPLISNGRHYVIFFPEILNDYTEYQHLLEECPFITIVPVKSLAKDTPCIFYDNTREELRKTALFIQKLCVSKNGTQKEKATVLWHDIAISIPDMATFSPYICRELDLYNIPYQLRSGKKLTEYSSGRLFELIKNCNTESFSFAALRNLILNPAFPWKDIELNNELIIFGIKNNCLHAYDNNDPWLLAFKTQHIEHRMELFYTAIKKHIQNLCNAKSFLDIRKHYFAFKDKFFDQDNFTENANLILSRCNVELENLIDLEATYPLATECKNPFNFFIKKLTTIDYVVQQKTGGVNIFPYKVAAGAPFRQHIVINSTQDDLNITQQPMRFLSLPKRESLGITETNMSDFFISLYALHSKNQVRFSCSNKNFKGFQIIHNSLKQDTCIEDFFDSYQQEKKIFTENTEFIQSNANWGLYPIQKQGFFQFYQKKMHASVLNDNFILQLKEQIDNHVRIMKTGKIRVSPTTLKDFFYCPRYWLFVRILNVRETSLQATLLDSVYIGTLYHEIIRRVLQIVQEKNAQCILEQKVLPQYVQKAIIEKTDEVITGLPSSCNIKKSLSSLTLEILSLQKAGIIERLNGFFVSFFSWFYGSRVLSTEEEIIHSMPQWELHGTLDCTLAYPGNIYMNEGIYIVDFKTAQMPSRSECLVQNGVLQDFQLASYVKLYEKQYCSERPWVQGAGFFSIHYQKPYSIVGILKNTGLDIRAHPYRKKDRLLRTDKNEADINFEDTMSALNTYIDVFVNAINDENAAIFINPPKVEFAKCQNCKYKTICRTTYSI